MVELLLLEGADPDVTDKVSTVQWWLYLPLSSIPICIMIIIDYVCDYHSDLMLAAHLDHSHCYYYFKHLWCISHTFIMYDDDDYECSQHDDKDDYRY